MAKTSGLPLGLIWKDHINDTPPQPYPVPVTCSVNQVGASGSRGVYHISLSAGSSVGVMRLTFNTGNYLLPGSASGGPATAVNSIPDRLVWDHGIYYNEDAGSSIGGNFYANDSSGATDVPVITTDSENLSLSSNLERVKQVGLIGGERFFQSSGNIIVSCNNLRGTIPKSSAHHANSPSGVNFGQDENGIFLTTPIFDYDASLNSGNGGFAQRVINSVNQTTSIGPYGGWLDRNTNKTQSTLTPNLKTHDNSNDGDFFDIEADWQSSGTLALQIHSAGYSNSIQQAETYFPSFHASRNAVYCVPIIPGNISSGTVTLRVEAPLQSTWFGIAYECPIDMETADSGNHKLNRSIIRTNWNQTCNTGNVNTTVYHMPVDAYGGVNPASVGRDENGIPVKTVNTYSPVPNHNPALNSRVVSDVRGSDGRDLWESLVSNYYITQNGRGGANSWKAAITAGATPESLVRDWYGMQDCVKSQGSFAQYGFPATNQITVPNATAVSGAPASASTNIEVGDLVVTGDDNTFGANGTNGNITVTAVNGSTITVSGMTMSTQTALTGLDPVLTFVRMGDIQTKGHFDSTLYNSNTTDLNSLTGQTNGDIGIRDYLFTDRYGASPLDDGFYKIIDKNAVDNGNGGKKRVKIKNGIIIKCRNCFGSVKNR